MKRLENALLTREDKGRELANWVKQINETTYLVPSRSTTMGQEYQVQKSKELGSWLCSCADFVYRGGECKHVIAVKQKLQQSEGVEKREFVKQEAEAREELYRRYGF